MSAGWQVVIGLEVHAQLRTVSKLFSGASTDFGAPPNAHTQALCLGLPGALPVLNQHAVTLALRAGLALGCTINEVSEFSRKHYFYPDSPKGYQITQYERPLCQHGQLTVTGADGGERVVRIERIHMEEDAGKSVHDARRGKTWVDLNRAGTPLIEIVSAPDLRSADEAVEYLKALREVLVFVGVNDGNLEEGSFRCDANVSVKRVGAAQLGTRCELKNLNSFRFIKAAIEFEAARHIEVLEQGGAIVQQTRLFDPDAGETRNMRSKEDAHDYRYFPEPDLPLLRVAKDRIEAERAALPELPRARRHRYITALGLPAYDAGVLTADHAVSDVFDAWVTAGAEAKKASNWAMGELSRLLKETGEPASALRFSPAAMVELLALVESGTLAGAAAKDVFAELFKAGGSPAAVMQAKGLGQSVDEGELDAVVEGLLAAHPKNVESYRAGKTQLLGFFVGQAMKALKGKGNARVLSERFEAKLKG